MRKAGSRVAIAPVVCSITALAFVAAAPAAAAPSVATPADQVALGSVAGAELYGDGYAIPLEGERPDWYTAKLRRRVLAADGQPVAAPPDAPYPGEVGIRPGSWMIAPSGCTMNFVFRSGSSLGIGTAGHCAKVGQPVVLLTVAPGGSNPVLVDIGTTAISRDNGVGDDFALVKINATLKDWVFPTIAMVGGPCGQYTGSGPETVGHYGHGLAIGTGGTPRAGVALTWKADMFGWDGAAIFGDSGSAVRVTGLRAAGDLTHLVVDSRYLPSFIAGTRIGKIEKVNGSWTMVSSPLCPLG